MMTLAGILLALSMHAATVEQYAADLESQVSALEMQIDELETNPVIEYRTEYVEPESIECGACGAHVLEWWYVQSADGEPVEVCEYCYRIFND